MSSSTLDAFSEFLASPLCENTSIAEYATRILALLSKPIARRKALGEAGIAPPLVALLRNAGLVGYAIILDHLAVALANLSRCETNWAPLGTAGIANPLVRPCRVLAGSCLHNCHTSHANLWSCWVNTFRRLCPLASVTPSPSPGTTQTILLSSPVVTNPAVTNPSIVGHLLVAVANLARLPENRSRLGGAGLIIVLTNLLSTPVATSAPTARHLFRALGNILHCSADNKRLLGQAGAARPLIELLQKQIPVVTLNVDLVEELLWVLANMAAYPDNRPLLGAAGAIGALATIMGSPLINSSPALLKPFARALANLTETCPENQHAANSLIPQLVALLRPACATPHVAKHFCRALACMAADCTENQRALAGAGVFGPLVGLLRAQLPKPHAIVSPALFHALAILCQDDALERWWRDAQIAEPLLGLLDCPLPDSVRRDFEQVAGRCLG